MPRTVDLLGLKENWWVEERHDPYKSTDAAIRYIDYLYERFNQDIYLVLVAYNAGPTFTSKSLQKKYKKILKFFIQRFTIVSSNKKLYSKIFSTHRTYK